MRLARLAVAAVVVGSAFAGLSAASALSPEPCPDGYTGVTIENNGSHYAACTNLLPGYSVTPCPHGRGVDVTVNGKHVSACLTA
jgi:NADH dehydrogenase FAD-containing subunit